MGTSKRVLLGCIVALATMLAFELLATVSGWRLGVAFKAAGGELQPGSLLATFVAMLLGGLVARRNFRWIALGLSALLWLAVLAALRALADPPLSLLAILRFNAVAIVGTLALAWLGAWLAEHLAQRRAEGRALPVPTEE